MEDWAKQRARVWIEDHYTHPLGPTLRLVSGNIYVHVNDLANLLREVHKEAQAQAAASE